MPICPSCRSEYREGFRECADCHVDLVAELPTAPAPAAPAEWSQIFAGDVRSAEILRATLESAGIKTVAPDENNTQIRGSAASGGEVRLFVATVDLPKAQELLKGDAAAQVGEDEEELLRFPCSCGQTLEIPILSAGTEMECPYCGRPLTAPQKDSGPTLP